MDLWGSMPSPAPTSTRLEIRGSTTSSGSRPRLARSSQKRRARYIVDRACKRRTKRVPVPGSVVRRVCPREGTEPSGTRRRYARAPGTCAPKDVTPRRTGPWRSTLCEAFLHVRWDEATCLPRRSLTEDALMGPFRSGPRSPSSPSAVGHRSSRLDVRGGPLRVPSSLPALRWPRAAFACARLPPFRFCHRRCPTSTT